MDKGSSNNSKRYDLISVLSSKDRDFLVMNNGKKVQVRELVGKIVGLYFDASRSPHFHDFYTELKLVYHQLSPKANFEVVFVSYDENHEAFGRSFSIMPWLAIPSYDYKSIMNLCVTFGVVGVPHLIIFDGTGQVLTHRGVDMLMEKGATVEFTPLKLWRVVELDAYRKQSLQFFLASSSRDYLISRDGNRTPVSELEGKLVGLFFFIPLFWPRYHGFTKKLMEAYDKLKQKEADFEVVMVYMEDHDEEEEFDEWLQQMPWYALPYRDKNRKKLARYFWVESFPRLVIIGKDGKALNHDATQLVQKYGALAYPFKPGKLSPFDRDIVESYTLKSLLVSGELEYVIDRSGSQVSAFGLTGKPLLIYLSSVESNLCQDFTQQLIEAYQAIKAKEDEFEIIFVCMDGDQSSFDECYSNMPWLALPFGDERKNSLRQDLKVKDLPTVVAIAPNGEIITAEATHLIATYGAEAYPFTEDHINQLAKRLEETAKGWPEKLNHPVHDEHELMKAFREDGYLCGRCKYPGHGWSFYCKDCNLDFHSKCVMNGDE